MNSKYKYGFISLYAASYCNWPGYKETALTVLCAVFHDYKENASGHSELTHCGLVTPYGIRHLDKHLCRCRFVACSVPSPYLYQCWHNVNCYLGNKLQWKLSKNTNIFGHENALEKVVCTMATILFLRQWVNEITAVILIRPDWRPSGMIDVVLKFWKKNKSTWCHCVKWNPIRYDWRMFQSIS